MIPPWEEPEICKRCLVERPCNRYYTECKSDQMESLADVEYEKKMDRNDERNETPGWCEREV